MAPRLIILAVAAAGAGGGLSGCRAPLPDSEVAMADAGLSSFGAGRTRLDFRKLEPLDFKEGDWSDPAVDVPAVQALALVLSGGGRVWLVGVGDDGVASEHGRQQGLARALATRSALVRSGAPADRILVTGVAAEEAAGLTGREGNGPRVEAAVVR